MFDSSWIQKSLQSQLDGWGQSGSTITMLIVLIQSRGDWSSILIRACLPWTGIYTPTTQVNLLVQQKQCSMYDVR